MAAVAFLILEGVDRSRVGSVGEAEQEPRRRQAQGRGLGQRLRGAPGLSRLVIELESAIGHGGVDPSEEGGRGLPGDLGDSTECVGVGGRKVEEVVADEQ